MRIDENNTLLKVAARRKKDAETSEHPWQEALIVFLITLVAFCFLGIGWWLADSYTECRSRGHAIGHCARAVFP